MVHRAASCFCNCRHWSSFGSPDDGKLLRIYYYQNQQQHHDHYKGRGHYCSCCYYDASRLGATMRWFRKGSEDNAPRLISLSPLRPTASGFPSDFSPVVLPTAATATSAGAGWTYQRQSRMPADDAVIGLPPVCHPYHRRSKSSLAPAVPVMGDIDVDAVTCQDHHQEQQQQQQHYQQHSHLPCTLKRKPAVRRRSGGKG